jgi:hypothetical protein
MPIIKTTNWLENPTTHLPPCLTTYLHVQAPTARRKQRKHQTPAKPADEYSKAQAEAPAAALALPTPSPAAELPPVGAPSPAAELPPAGAPSPAGWERKVVTAPDGEGEGEEGTEEAVGAGSQAAAGGAGGGGSTEREGGMGFEESIVQKDGSYAVPPLESPFAAAPAREAFLGDEVGSSTWIPCVCT